MGAIIPAVKVNLAASGSVVLESPIIIEDKEVSRMTPQEYAQGLRELGFQNVEQGKVLNYNENDLGVYSASQSTIGIVMGLSALRHDANVNMVSHLISGS